MYPTVPVFSTTIRPSFQTRKAGLVAFDSDVCVGLPSDVTPQIIHHTPAPALRSLSQTNRGWNDFLFQWREFRSKNFEDFEKTLRTAEYPKLRVLDIAENIIRWAPRYGFTDWLSWNEPKYQMPSRIVCLTILSQRTGVFLEGSAQQINTTRDQKMRNSSTVMAAVPCVGPDDIAVDFVNKCTAAGRAVYLFEDMLDVISAMPDRDKAHAFIALVKRLPAIQRQYEMAGNDSNWLVDLRFAAPYLVPKRWSIVYDFSEIEKRGAFAEQAGFPVNSAFVEAVRKFFPYLGKARADFSISLFRLLRGFYIYSPVPSCKSYISLFPREHRLFFYQILSAAVRCGLLNKADQKKCWSVLKEIGFYDGVNATHSMVKHYAYWSKDF